MYNHVFSQVSIGKLTLKNRLVVPPMVANMFTENGEVTDQYIAYMTERAKGGFGLIITENLGISNGARAFARNGGIWTKAQCEGLARLTNEVHKAGGKIVSQLYHAGRETCSAVTGEICVAPSSLKDPTVNETPRELSRDEIKQIARDFGFAALRAKNAGFDAVEIHCAHGYLLNEFLSPFSNKRTDEYGISVLNRGRIVREVIEEIKRTTGKDYPLLARISVDELVCGGLTVEDMKAYSRLFEEWGLDAIDVSFGVFTSGGRIAMNQYGQHAQMTVLAGEIKKSVSIPVIAVGRIHDPLVADSVIASGQADMVAIGRGSIADAHMPNKALVGHPEEIAVCMGCRQVCNANLFAGRPLACIMNPESCNEYLGSPKAVEKSKRVLVVGGGPAGMEAAISAARRGHKVKLVEKSGRLGGQWLLAMVPPHKQEFGNMIAYLTSQLNALGVEVALNSQADESSIAREGADEVILATGAQAKAPDIEISGTARVLTEWDVLGLKAEANGRVAVVNCGVQCGETADLIATQLNQVTLVERGKVAARYSDDSISASLKEELIKLGVSIHENINAVRIENEWLITKSEDGKEQKLGPFDAFVLCTGRESTRIVSHPGWRQIGDANAPASAQKAVLDGYAVGCEV